MCSGIVSFVEVMIPEGAVLGLSTTFTDLYVPCILPLPS